VARDALALPLGQYDPVAHACWEPGASARLRSASCRPKVARLCKLLAPGQPEEGGGPCLHKSQLRAVSPLVPASAGQPTPYLHLARAFDLMHGTKKRLRISGGLPAPPALPPLAGCPPALQLSRWCCQVAHTHTHARTPPPASDVLVNCFRSVLALSPDDLVPAAYLATGRVAPDYEGVELQASLAGRGQLPGLQQGVGRSRCHAAVA
jgi:hypothetical protein